MALERRIAYLSEGSDPDGPFRAVSAGDVVLVNPDGDSALTPEGGFALKLTNRTGFASVKGSLVSAHPSVDNAFALTPAGSDNHFGVVYESNVADGSPCLVVVEGRAQALLEDGEAGVPAYGVNGSTSVAGRVQTTPVAPGDVGNCLETVASGTDVLVFCMLNGGGGAAMAAGLKAGLLIPGAFGGTPKQASVVFATSFADANYTITMDVESINDRSWGLSIQAKTAAGFTLSLGSNSVANLVRISWQAIPVGE